MPTVRFLGLCAVGPLRTNTTEQLCQTLMGHQTTLLVAAGPNAISITN